MLALLIAAKLAFNVVALLASGLALHMALGMTPRDHQRPVLRLAAAASMVLTVLAAARIALLNAQLGDGLADAFDVDLFEWSWLALGPASMGLAAGALLIVIAWPLRSRIAAGLGAIAIAASFPLTGHVSGLQNAVWLQTLLAAHVLIAGFWIAAPLTLWPAREADTPRLAGRLRRFSLFATAAIPLLVIAGVLLALQLAGGFAGLVSTAYGQLLLAKLAATLAALTAGAVNRQMVTARMETDPATAQRWLKRTLAIEAAAFAVAIAAVSLATTVWPPAYA